MRAVVRDSALPASDSVTWQRHASLLLMFVSGFAGLAYQLIWTQQAAVWLGHEAAAVLAVVTAFFGGLALGALLLGGRIERSPWPGRWYAGCELLIAAWSLVLIAAIGPIGEWLLRITGVQPDPAWQWSVAFGGTFLLLLPATAAMGATLPAMEHIVADRSREPRSIASLYASNTLGAVTGVLAIAFWLVPEFGLSATARICVAMNLCAGLCALRVFGRQAPPLAFEAAREGRGLLLILACTGLLGIGYEVLVVRVLSQVAENTVYTFALLLAVYLLGTAAGAAAYARLRSRWRDPGSLRDALLCATALACLLGASSLWGAGLLKTALLADRGAGMTRALVAEAALALAAFGLPTLMMGALFSHLGAVALASRHSFGRALGANTLGAAAAPLLFGVLAFPAVGPQVSLLLIVAGYLALTSRRAWLHPMAWIPSGVVLAAMLWAPRLAFVDIPQNGRLLIYEEGVLAAVSVVEDADGVASLRIDNREQEGSSATRRVDARHALLPMLLHPDPHRVLFLGLGTGITATAAAQVPGIQVDAVELVPEVIAASEYFRRPITDDATRERLRVIAADARRYVRASDRRYDVIVSDNFHPARSGSAALYTAEHFEAVRARLAPGGVFCQWLPLHQLDLQTLRSIVRSFLRAYPQGTAMLASNSLATPALGLVGRRDAGAFDGPRWVEHLRARHPPPDLAPIGIEDEYALLGSFVAGPAALDRFAGDAPANTDDRPVVAYRAPRITYQPDSLPADRLISLLEVFWIEPAELLGPAIDAETSRRLATYWAARTRFIESGRDVQPSADPARMLARVRDPLIEVLRISADFRPAYDPLLMLAAALVPRDAIAARALLAQLIQLQPMRPEAGELLRRIENDAP